MSVVMILRNMGRKALRYGPEGIICCGPEGITCCGPEGIAMWTGRSWPGKAYVCNLCID